MNIIDPKPHVNWILSDASAAVRAEAAAFAAEIEAGKRARKEREKCGGYASPTPLLPEEITPAVRAFMQKLNQPPTGEALFSASVRAETAEHEALVAAGRR